MYRTRRKRMPPWDREGGWELIRVCEYLERHSIKHAFVIGSIPAGVLLSLFLAGPASAAATLALGLLAYYCGRSAEVWVRNIETAARGPLEPEGLKIGLSLLGGTLESVRSDELSAPSGSSGQTVGPPAP